MNRIALRSEVVRYGLVFLVAAVFTSPVSGANAPATALLADTAFFPIAVWLQSPANAAAYKNAGINLFVGLWEGPTKDQLDQMVTAGMPVICDQNQFGLANVEKYKSVILGWMHMDEPDNAQSDGNGGYGPCVSPDTVIQKYNAWKSNDPLRPVYLNLGQGVANIEYIGRGSACHGRTDMYPRYLQGCDIASFDIYPVNSEYAEIKGNLWYVAKGVDSLRMWGGGSKKAWCWIECTRIDSSSPAAPSPAQVKAEVWMALIHGANGIGYFCHSWYGGFKEAGWLGNTAMKTAITAINSRIAALAPVLNGPSVSGKATVESSIPIDILAKSHSGSLYIFCVGMRGAAGTGTFSVAGLGGQASVEVLDENRSIAAVNGRFQDSLGGYGVRLYRVSSTSVLNNRRPSMTAPFTGGYHRVVIMNDSRYFPFWKNASNPPSAVFSTQGRLITTLPAIGKESTRLKDRVCIIRR
jgi:hypothetical protein